MKDKIDYIIIRYLSGKASTEEEKILLEWMKLSPENQEMFFETKIIWNTKNKDKDIAEDAYMHSFEKLRNRIREREKKPLKNRIKKYLLLGGGIAAILSGIVFLISTFMLRPSSPLLITYSNTLEDSIMRIVLDDQSIVWLNTNTTLKAFSTFSGKERLVELEGCAFFEVTKENERPFIVKTDEYQIRVLGTSFGVNTFYSHNKCETVLLEGSVKLEDLKGERITILEPGQQALYSKESKVLDINKIDARKYALWRFGIISLTNVSIVEIIRSIESVYNIKVEMNTMGLEKHKYNFSFKNKNNAEDALRYLNYLTGRTAEIIHPH